MAPLTEWVLLAYRLPREPSTPRIALWRKLRRLGAVQLVDGLVALPATSANREQFDWLADEVVHADGEAWTWTAAPGSKEQERALVARMATAAGADYRALVDEVHALLSTDEPIGQRTVDRVRRELHRVEGRDPAPAADRTEARRAVARLEAARAAREERVR